MARQTEKLTALEVANAKTPGLYPDGGGLYLQISKEGAASWIYRFTLRGRTRDMGLGSRSAISLKAARLLAGSAREQRARGIDPIEARDAARREKSLAAARAMTFREFATAYMDAQKAGWRNPKHAAQWPASLKNDAYPILGDLPLPSITVDHVVSVLRPLWVEKNESARRLRGRIAKILGAAKAQDLRDGPNPAAWHDNLEHLLPRISRARRIKHFRALPYADAPALMARLRAMTSISALAARFVILTACRTGEMRGATWSEFDLPNRTWLVPAERIKAGKAHRVPLTDEAIAILDQLKGLSKTFVFPGRKGGSLSDGTLLMMLKQIGYRKVTTAHGLRSTFRMWAAEQTSHPREVCEQALAHSEENEVEQAYMRSDHFGKRVRLMADWAAFLAPEQTGEQEAA